MSRAFSGIVYAGRWSTVDVLAKLGVMQRAGPLPEVRGFLR
jgi:hypothetical protein